MSLLFSADCGARPHNHHHRRPFMKRQHVAVNLSDKTDLSDKGAEYDIVKHEDDMIKQNLLPTIKDVMMQQALVKSDESSSAKYPGTLEEQVLPAISAMKFTGGGVAEEASMQQWYKTGGRGLENPKNIDLGASNGLLMTEGFNVGNKDDDVQRNDKVIKSEFTKVNSQKKGEENFIDGDSDSRHNVFQDSVSFHDGFAKGNRASVRSQQQEDDDDEMEDVPDNELEEPKTKPLVSDDDNSPQSHLDDTSKRNHANTMDMKDNQNVASSSSSSTRSSNKKSTNGDNGVVSHVLEAVFGQQNSPSDYGVHRENLTPSMSMFLPSDQNDEFSQ